MNERRRFSRHRSACVVEFTSKTVANRCPASFAMSPMRARASSSLIEEPAFRMKLIIPKRKRIAHASVRWRHGDKLGLALSEVRRHTGERRAHLRTPSAARRR